ncbi:hypothetical protein [Streptomyces sp. B93]|uniref:hypothetical protein n=1 Tax=Streptomyces sp. B93 TaxID=2824875 RepID=UPI001B3590AA|nr:hypothetical protein [Streptomyces sp. B93]MBQ1092184.1 hypothetical protein [Streptomyces sp. B93]
MTRPPHPEHDVEDLCDAGTQLYDRTLAEGRIAAADAESAPCLLDIGLLSPALGSESRAQLGYLIARSGILKQEGTEE